MRLDLAVFADAANTTADGKINLLGEFNMVHTADLPAALPSATLVLRIVGSAAESGEHRFGLRLRDDDGHLLWTSPDSTLVLPQPQIPGLPVRTALIIEIGPFMFDEFRTYAYEVVVDDRRLGEVEIHVIRDDQLPGPTA
jgi:hypothetical protein